MSIVFGKKTAPRQRHGAEDYEASLAYERSRSNPAQVTTKLFHVTADREEEGGTCIPQCHNFGSSQTNQNVDQTFGAFFAYVHRHLAEQLFNTRLFLF